ncbi:MAG: hypothetical protein H6511_00015, partial [Holophagales bacterium]|nr:hypothetical protein [Holophagales bacterium]
MNARIERAAAAAIVLAGVWAVGCGGGAEKAATAGPAAPAIVDDVEARLAQFAKVELTADLSA